MGVNNNILPLTMRSFRMNLSSFLHYFFLGENPKNKKTLSISRGGIAP